MLSNDWGTVNAIYNFGGMQEKDKANKVTGVIIKVYLSQNIQEYFIQKFFKGCLPQILLGPFLNTFSYLWLSNIWIYPIPIICFAKKLDVSQDLKFACGSDVPVQEESVY